MNILVTGASGYIGRELCSYLVTQGHRIIALSRQELNIAGCDCRTVADYRDVTAADFADIDAVVHLAARAHQANGSDHDILAAYRAANVQASVAIATAASAAGVTRFIYMSSIKVNGEATVTPFTAYDYPAPADAYGMSKWEAEQALAEVCAGQVMGLVIVRPPLVWGGQEKGNLAVLSRLIDKNVPMPFKSVHNRRDLVSLTNLCDFIQCCLRHPDAAGNTFLVCDGCALSTAEIVEALAAKNNRTARLFSVPHWVWRGVGKLPSLNVAVNKLVGNLELDITATRHITGWQPCSEHQKNV